MSAGLWFRSFFPCTTSPPPSKNLQILISRDHTSQSEALLRVLHSKRVSEQYCSYSFSNTSDAKKLKSIQIVEVFCKYVLWASYVIVIVIENEPHASYFEYDLGRITSRHFASRQNIAPTLTPYLSSTLFGEVDDGLMGTLPRSRAKPHYWVNFGHHTLSRSNSAKSGLTSGLSTGQYGVLLAL